MNRGISDITNNGDISNNGDSSNLSNLRKRSATFPPLDEKLKIAWVADRSVTGINRPHDRIALVLQGGGALGAYQAGAFEELSGTAFQPNWIVGVSIGAINAAIIAGNPPERRVERLSEFWHQVSSGLPQFSDASPMTRKLMAMR